MPSLLLLMPLFPVTAIAAPVDIAGGISVERWSVRTRDERGYQLGM